MNGVFFDLGKTLLDNYGYDQKDAMIAVYKQTDKNIPFSVVYEKYQEYHKEKFGEAKVLLTEVKLGKFLYDLLEKTNLKHSLTEDELEKIYFFEMTKYEGILEGSVDILKYFKDNNAIIIAVSNSCISSKNLLLGMNILGIGYYFNEVISSADILIRKPKLEIFEYAISKMKEYNVEKDNMLFIGNDYNCDVIGAKNAGLKVVWYNAGEIQKESIIADYNVKNYQELINILKR